MVFEWVHTMNKAAKQVFPLQCQSTVRPFDRNYRFARRKFQ